MILLVVLLLSVVCGQEVPLPNNNPTPPSFAAENEVHNQEHIKQHLENKIDVDQLSEEQQRFHYFAMHDLNKDDRIDGIEIIKALTHDHEHETGPGAAIDDEESMISMVDAVLKDMDLNDDGYIDFAEYSRSQK